MELPAIELMGCWAKTSLVAWAVTTKPVEIAAESEPADATSEYVPGTEKCRLLESGNAIPR